MTAAIITEASRLSQAIRKSADPLRNLASVLNILAAGTDDDELCRLLEWLALEATGAADSRDEAAEAKRAQLEEDGHRLALEVAADKRDEWETERRDAA